MKKLLTLLLLITITIRLNAEEGMWIPMLLEQLNIKQMQDMGLRLSAEDIYSVNHSSMKDAIVQFGGGCTAEIVSPDGLILTNHHCGLGAIQRLSSVEHDYLRNGFWAGSFEEELPAAGLSVTLLVRMEDVTGQVLKGVSVEMNELARNVLIKKNSDSIEKDVVKGTKYQAVIRSFYYGNQYYLFITQVFKDIRLAGAPPSAIGQFGGDTDNWMWPRHGADFSVFRIYADKNNEPAAYSKDNVPYKPKSFLPVSVKGYQKGDFTFVFGYPGTTREYLTSWGVDLTANKENPVRIELRQKRLDIFNTAMDASPKVRIQYTSKHQGIANGWKKMIGETRGIKKLDAISKKQEFEKRFMSWSKDKSSYNKILESLKNTYETNLSQDISFVYLTEGGLGIELVRFAGNFKDLIKIAKDKTKKDEEVAKAAEKLLPASRAFFKDYSAEIDKKVAVVMMEEMDKYLDPGQKPAVFELIADKYEGSYDDYVAYLFAKSMLADSGQVYGFLNNFKRSGAIKLEKDPAWQLYSSVFARIEKLSPVITSFNSKIDSLQRIYMAGQMEMQKDKRFYPDANSTLRIAYGKVDDYFPADAVHYNYFTTSDGILQKEDSTIYDYAVDAKLKDLFRKKDFGRYADADGTLHIAFTGSNHTTGGNSGSPVLDANGYLIGINYDRNWEGTLSDLMYDPSQCRNITLDIRYCLFVIDRYAGAKRLINEMKIIGGDQTTNL